MSITSTRITRADASLIHKQAMERNTIVAWVVTENPSDLPSKFVARPWSVETGQYFHAHLEADSLDAIRWELPVGLVRMGRATGEDPVIVETWL